MKLDHDQITKTFHLLSRRTGIVWWAARRVVDGKEEFEGSYASSPFELVEFAEAYKGWNFYVQPNASNKRHGRRCRTEDVLSWDYFLVDLDPTGESWPSQAESEHAAATIVCLMEAYSGIKHLWPYVIYSGRGTQLWFPLMLDRGEDYPVSRISPETDEPEVLRRIPWDQAIPLAQSHWLSYLASHFDNLVHVVDTSTSDLPRLMRCPGTINYKTGRLAAFMRTDPVEVSPLLANKILDYTPAAKLQTHEQAHVLPGVPWQVAASLTHSRTAADFLSFGATEPGRHKVAVATARALAEAGVSEGEIIAALVWGGERSRPVLDDMAYIVRTAHDAYRRFGLDISI